MSDWFIAGAFLALPYVIYAVIQTVRGQTRPNKLGVLLACIAVIVPIALLALNESGALSLMTPVILANAVIVLVISGVIMISDYRRPGRDLNHSFGTLGLGVSTLLIIGIFTTPFTLSQFSSTASAAQVNVPAFAADTTLAANSQAEAAQESTGTNPLQAIIAAETGLTIDEVLEQLNAGAVLVDLIAAGGGDVDVVTAALTEAIEAGIAGGTIPAPMVERMGGDAASIASSAINGEIPGMILSGILSGSMPGSQGGFGAAGGPPAEFTTPDSTDSTEENTPIQFPIRQGDFAPPAEATAEAMPVDSESVGAENPTATPIPSDEAENPTQVVIVQSARDSLPTPTPFLFDAIEPTSTPVITEETEGEDAPAQNICSLIVNFNLNMREEPNPDGAWILTIPAYTTVTAAGQNADNWWQVTYQNESGWVSGEYVTPAADCNALAVLP